ncbi:MAG: hypothetical protein H0V50_00810 [Thermoleophilaceae bacterium]|nr:hypothetical protein [Thermoleophilaceae bacterium]
MIAYDLVKLIREIAADGDRAVEEMSRDGVVDAVEGRYASVRLGANDNATPSFYVPPGLAVTVGDHVLVYRNHGFQMITDVLNRNALTGSDQPDSVAGSADYLARMKRRADVEYRLQVGLDALDQAVIEAGSGSTPTDARIARTAAGEWTVTDTLAVGGAIPATVLRLLIEREWLMEQRVGSSGTATALQLRPAAESSSFNISTSDGTIIATFRDEALVPRLSFYGVAPVAKPTVTGSRGGNVALASLLTALSQLGLVVDATT